MSPDTLRILDRHLGRAICALLGGAELLVKKHPGKVEAPALPRRVLFVQLAEGGSMILAAPALRAAMTQGMDPWFLTFDDNAAALRLTQTVPAEQVLTIRGKKHRHLISDLPRILRRIRQLEFDTIVDMELCSQLTTAFAYLCGSPRRIGFVTETGQSARAPRSRLLTHPVSFSQQRHMSENYLNLVAAAIPIDDQGKQLPTPPNLQKFRPDATSRLLVAELLSSRRLGAEKKIILVNANASQRLVQRRWPIQHFVDLINQLLAIRPDATVLLIGSAEDRTTNALVTQLLGQHARTRCHDVAGEFPVDTLPALFERSSLLISNDSGPAHFASVTDLPIIVMFGPETPRLFSPLGRVTVISANLSCSPCVSIHNQRTSRCQDNRCMQQIPVTEVLNEAINILNPARIFKRRHDVATSA